MYIDIRQQAFDPWQELAAYRERLPAAGRSGACAVFVGTMRDYNEGDSVRSMVLEHYPGMTEQVIQGLIDDASKRWDVRKARVIHRVGRLALCDQIVFVGVCSAHRGDAFAACEFIMDALKTSAPFWKKEITSDGEHWVEQKESDRARSEDWK